MVWRVSEEENVEVTAILGDSYDEIENDALRIGFVICRRAKSRARLGWTLEVDVIISCPRPSAPRKDFCALYAETEDI